MENYTVITQIFSRFSSCLEKIFKREKNESLKPSTCDFVVDEIKLKDKLKCNKKCLQKKKKERNNKLDCKTIY